MFLESSRLCVFFCLFILFLCKFIFILIQFVDVRITCPYLFKLSIVRRTNENFKPIGFCCCFSNTAKEINNCPYKCIFNFISIMYPANFIYNVLLWHRIDSILSQYHQIDSHQFHILCSLNKSHNKCSHKILCSYFLFTIQIKKMK